MLNVKHNWIRFPSILIIRKSRYASQSLKNDNYTFMILKYLMFCLAIKDKIKYSWFFKELEKKSEMYVFFKVFFFTRDGVVLWFEANFKKNKWRNIFVRIKIIIKKIEK